MLKKVDLTGNLQKKYDSYFLVIFVEEIAAPRKKKRVGGNL